MPELAHKDTRRLVCLTYQFDFYVAAAAGAWRGTEEPQNGLVKFRIQKAF